jgi:hypothetical protein
VEVVGGGKAGEEEESAPSSGSGDVRKMTLVFPTSLALRMGAE